MFAHNEISERGLFRRLRERGGREDVMGGRAGLADTIDGAIRDAAGTSVPPRYRVARPVVVLSAASALSAVADALRDADAVVAPEAIEELRRFMTDGAQSPLYRDDALAARRAADDLRRRIVPTEGAPLATAAAVT
jgi:hypothetical protein